jgi:hypothetical protein
MATRGEQGAQRFPATHASAIQRIQSHDPALRAAGRKLVAEIYWKPVYTYARLRTFLRVCLDRFVTDRHRRQMAAKRGGGVLTFDFTAAERELADTAESGGEPEHLFERAWVRHVMALAVERLRADLTARGKLQHLHIFERFHLDDAPEPPSYAAIAQELGISVTDVTNRLSYARRTFRSAAVAILRQITVNEDEFRDEMRALFGSEAASREGGAAG